MDALIDGKAESARRMWSLIVVALIVAALVAWAITSSMAATGDLNAPTAVEYGLIA